MNKENITFEQAMTRLEEISSLLGGAGCALEDMLGLYDEAQKLISFCEERLKNAKLRVTTIEE